MTHLPSTRQTHSTAMALGIAIGQTSDPDAPEHGYLLCGKTAVAVALSLGYKGQIAQSFAQGYLLGLGQLVKV